MTGKEKRLLFYIYAAANIWMLFIQGVFWDDWTVFNMDFAGLKESWDRNGMIFPSYIYHFLNLLPFPVFCFRLSAFLLGWGITLYSTSLIRKLDFIPDPVVMPIGLLIASSPLYHTRILLIGLQYSIALFAFILAFRLTVSFVKRGTPVNRLVALLLFAFSFLISSLLVFYGAVLFYLFITVCHKRLKDLYKIADFIILPVAFWILKAAFLPVSGLHALEGYNAITLKGVLESPAGIMQAFHYSFLETLNRMIDTMTINYIIPLILVMLWLISVFKNTVQVKTIHDQHIPLLKWRFSDRMLVLVYGLILFVLGAFAYVVVDKIPVYDNFNARNQLLLPFGTAFILAGLTGIFIQKEKRMYVYSFLIAASIIVNIRKFIDYQKDTLRQDGIMENLRGTDLSNKYNILVRDHSEKYVETETSQVVFTGMAKYITGEETRMLISEGKAADLEKEYGSLAVLKTDPLALNIRSWQPGAFTHLLTIDDGAVSISSLKNLIRLTALKYSDHDLYKAAIRETIAMKLDPITTQTTPHE